MLCYTRVPTTLSSLDKHTGKASLIKERVARRSLWLVRRFGNEEFKIARPKGRKDSSREYRALQRTTSSMQAATVQILRTLPTRAELIALSTFNSPSTLRVPYLRGCRADCTYKDKPGGVTWRCAARLGGDEFYRLTKYQFTALAVHF